MKSPLIFPQRKNCIAFKIYIAMIAVITFGTAHYCHVLNDKSHHKDVIPWKVIHNIEVVLSNTK